MDVVWFVFEVIGVLDCYVGFVGVFGRFNGGLVGCVKGEGCYFYCGILGGWCKFMMVLVVYVVYVLYFMCLKWCLLVCCDGIVCGLIICFWGVSFIVCVVL